MKDKDGFDIRCIHSEWMIIDDRDNKDFVCQKFPTYNYGAHQCYCDENANITSLTRKGMIMGEFGYFYGYSMVFVFLVGCALGFVIGRWFS